MMRVGHQQQQRNNNMGGYNNNNQQQNRNRRYNYNQNMMMMNRKPMHMYSYKGLWNDKLIGMMTDKEKNWVVNVQMLQLQIDDPYKLDFYYTVIIIFFIPKYRAHFSFLLAPGVISDLFNSLFYTFPSNYTYLIESQC